MNEENKKVSPTEEILKLRAAADDPVVPGQWHAGFSKVKAFAEEKGIPLIAIWTNGDVCYNCKVFEQNCLEETFLEWQKNSGCIFWLGTSADNKTEDAAEDGTRGVGYNWLWKVGRINAYPFASIYWPDGGVIVFTTGVKLDGGSNPKWGGAEKLVKNLSAYLKDWNPNNALPMLGQTTKTLKIRPNQDWTPEEIEAFKQKIKDNGGYCPCQIQSEDSKCMCKDMRDKKTPGLCICGLYQKYYEEENQ